MLHALTKHSGVWNWGAATAAAALIWISLVLWIGKMRINRTKFEQLTNRGIFSGWPSSNSDLFARENYSPRGKRLWPWLIISLVVAIACGVRLMVELAS